jgi:DNA-binding NarL/FixJ family response regulator
MDYRSECAQIRARRDGALARARDQLAALKDERDQEILRLRAEGLTHAQIGERLGCSKCTVAFVLDPAARLADVAYHRSWRAKLKAV